MSRASPQQAWTPRSSDRKAAGVCGVTPQGRAVGGGPFSLCSQSLAIIGKVWGPQEGTVALIRHLWVRKWLGALQHSLIPIASDSYVLIPLFLR